MIPGKFMLFGHEWSVEFDPMIAMREQLIGKCDYEKKKITLQPNCDEYKLAESIVEQTLYHELIHAIFNELGLSELGSDEKIVDPISQLLYQYEVTKISMDKM